jgi:tRNA threonylcarbamoyladenosine biosynthesis protein TsaE
MEWIFSLDKISNIAKEFWAAVTGKNVIAFHGQMGAGKTTFINALCIEKGVRDVVGSPTFSIINEYSFIIKNKEGDTMEKPLFHLDLYRIRDEEEALRAGIEDCLYSGNICLVEWPEKASGIFPENTVHAYIDAINDTTRSLKIYKNLVHLK